MSLDPRTLILLLAIACFVGAAVWTPPSNVRINLVAVGLALVALALLLTS